MAPKRSHNAAGEKAKKPISKATKAPTKPKPKPKAQNSRTQPSIVQSLAAAPISESKWDGLFVVLFVVSGQPHLTVHRVRL